MNEDLKQAQENIKELKSKIKEIKPNEININPFDNSFTLKNTKTIIKWKVKPKIFKVLAKVVQGKYEDELMETSFKINVDHTVGDTTLWAEMQGRFESFQNIKDDDDLEIKFGATMRF